jgi:serine/threonine protein kinase
MKFLQGGDMFTHIHNAKKFSEPHAKIYVAQIFLALEYLHTKNIIYRDLKPENVMMETNGYLKLVDFGICKKLQGSDDKTETFIGTPEYLSPEVILSHGYGLASDWWALGIFACELMTGRPAFYAPNENPHTMYKRIVKEEYQLPNNFTPECKDFINKLLVKKPENRMSNTAKTGMIKEHPWFKDFDWVGLIAAKLKAPIVPAIKDKEDLSYFDGEFTSQNPRNTEPGKKHHLVESTDFDAFNYSNFE